MNLHSEKSATAPVALSAASERKFIWLFGFLAALHVLIFSATFPFFNVVDEQEHFDLVVRYSHADIPRAVAPLSEEALDYVAIYYTPEYLWSPTNFPGGKIPPPAWTLPFEVAAKNLLDTKALWRAKVKNQEASQPPLYYSVAALWWHVGKWFGLDGGRILYWLRFLNIFFIVALVWIGHIAARTIFPGNSFLRLGVPAVIALIPQTAFYAIQNDVLSPLGFGVVFILLVKFWRAEIPDARLGTLTGLAVSATLLAKISNAPLLAVSALFVALKTFQLARAGKIRAAAPAIVSLALCAGVPVALRLAWCKYNFGDLTGSEAKIQFLGWTHKSFAEWWHHPIFTPHGFWAFFSDLLSTFWQGELLWDRQSLALPVADKIYVFSTLVLFGIALVGLLKKSSALEKHQRVALWVGFAGCVAAVAFLSFLSIIYDYHDCFRPSRAFPYFTSGRMILGALIPFLLLWFYGLDRLLGKFDVKAKFLVLAGLLLLMLATEITIDWKIFPNEYNWFHL